MIKFKIGIACITLIMSAMSCSNHKKFGVEGKITNANEKTAYLEKRGHNNDIEILDSMKLDSNGTFKFSAKALDYPEFYKLRIDNKNIEFIVDSIETINITGDFNNLQKDFHISGSENAKLMEKASKNIQKFASQTNDLQKEYELGKIDQATLQDSISTILSNYKAEVRNILSQDFQTPVGYYIIFQRYNGIQLLDPNNQEDLPIFRTVATVWDNNFSNSPRNETLKQYTLQAIANYKSQKQTERNLDELTNLVPIEDSEYFVVELPDEKGQLKSTKDSKGKMVILDFASYASQSSANRNIALNNIYNKYKNKVDIYQVTFDYDEHKWKNVANNLPWVTVRDNQMGNSTLINKFNLQTLPTIFLLDANGDMITRLNENDDLDKIISKELNK